MSPENTHKLMGFYIEGLVLGVIHAFLFKLFYRVYRVRVNPCLHVAVAAAPTLPIYTLDRSIMTPRYGLWLHF